jgi:hypothetical protein
MLIWKEKLFTVNLNLTAMHFASRVRRSRVVRLSQSSRFFMQAQHPNCGEAYVLVHPTRLL